MKGTTHTAALILKRVGLVLGIFVIGLGIWVFLFFRSLPPEQLVLGALTPAYRFPQTWFWTALRYRSIPPDYRTPGGLTVFQFSMANYREEEPATQGATLKLLGRLIEGGADVNAASRATGLRPLHDAVLYGSETLVEFLLNNGANPQLPAGTGKFEGQIPLQFAYTLGNRGGADRRGILALLEARTRRPN